jgi:hypothetical protein
MDALKSLLTQSAPLAQNVGEAWRGSPFGHLRSITLITNMVKMVAAAVQAGLAAGKVVPTSTALSAASFTSDVGP